ncbi:MAG: ABC transporter permease [Chloroflexaceae bacterium]|nr:ABC transporter permease [Chloroflexaceae bacterium]
MEPGPVTPADLDLSLDQSGAARSESQWQMVLRRFRHHRMAMICLAVLVVMLAASLLLPFFVARPRAEVDRAYRYLPPLVTDPAGIFHLLGTDNLGRDYLIQLIYAARVSLTVSVTVSTVATLIGLTLGLLAGYFGGWTDSIITRFLEFVATFPLFVILLILLAALLETEKPLSLPGPLIEVVAVITATPDHEAEKIALVILGMAGLLWPSTARLMRGMVLSVREHLYIESARALGASSLRIILKHAFPNAFPPLIVDYTLLMNTVLIYEASLSYLGFGIQDTPTWGNMLKAAEANMLAHPWMPLIPGLPILLASLAINYVGDGMRDALDPRLRK